MKYLLLPLLLLISGEVISQPALDSLQQVWVQKLKAGESTPDFYLENRNFIYAEIDSSDAQNFFQLLRTHKISGIDEYVHEQSYRHDDTRYVTAGRIFTNQNAIILLSAWRLSENEWKKEIDIILTRLAESTEVSSELEKKLNEEREKWVLLANQHDPANHIEQSYTEDAIYLGNGRKSTGRNEIIDRYSYMENPNYQVDLVKQELWNISDEKVLEIGRYFTGANPQGEGGIYIILWEKQTNKNWQIAFDFNF